MQKTSNELVEKGKNSKRKGGTIAKTRSNPRNDTESKAVDAKPSKNRSPKAEKKKREQKPDPLAYPPTGRPLLDLVLLAVIDAHPTKNVKGGSRWAVAERQKRLDQVKRILFGLDGSAGNTKVPDTLPLIWMADVFERQSSVIYRDLLSKGTPNDNVLALLPRAREQVKITPIAREAADRYYDKDANAPSRLEKKFRQKRDWLIEKLYEPDSTDSLCLSHAQGFCRLLKITGLSVIPPKEIWR